MRFEVWHKNYYVFQLSISDAGSSYSCNRLGIVHPWEPDVRCSLQLSGTLSHIYPYSLSNTLSIAMCRKGYIKYVQFPDTYAYFNAPFDDFFNHWLIYTCYYMI